MTAVALMSRPSPSGSVRALPSLLAPSTGSATPAPVITLPRLHIPSDATPSPFHSFAPAPLSSGVVLKPIASMAPTQYDNHSPQSPASFAPKPPSPEPMFGLAHLLEAAEQCQDFHNRTSGRTLNSSSPSHTQHAMALNKNRLHSIDYLINRPSDEERPAKRARPELQLDVAAPYHFTPQPPFHHSPQSVYQTAPYETTTPVFQGQATQYMNITPVGSQDEVMSQTDSQVDAKNVWETVLMTGNFPDDICLTENPTCGSKSNEISGNPVKQGRWTNDEKEFAENLIQQVRNGEVSLPPNTSLRKFIADSLQCKAMRVSKKFRSLRACQSPDGSSGGDDRKFNPLSLHSIMNDDADADSFDDEMEQQQSPKQSSKALKRSDYSQHGAVRSGRWSLEEENYAKAMIEAFKNGYLPLHGNVSLRKFLSEVLVCHPMRISKKFVGYVRKYHWYRIAAGKCDPEAKRVALEQLCHLEREFWASLQQNQEWATIQQDNRR